MDTRPLGIIGAGGHASVIADMARLNGWNKLDFYADQSKYHALAGTIDDLVNKLDSYQDVFVAIGNNNTRHSLIDYFLKLHKNLPVIAHPSACISSDATIGPGTAIMPMAVINANASIGTGCIVNTSAIVEHDCKVYDSCHISPGARIGGTVNIGQRTWIGMGATIINNISICNDTIIGAGSTVIRSISEQGVYVGNPAIKIKKRQNASGIEHQ